MTDTTKKPELKVVPSPNPQPKKNPVDDQIPYKTIAITAAVTAAVAGVIGILIHETWGAGKRLVNGEGKQALPPAQNPDAYQPPPLLPPPSTYFMAAAQAQLPPGQQAALVPMGAFGPPQLPIHDQPAWLAPFVSNLEQRFSMIQQQMESLRPKKNPDDEWEYEE